MASSHFFFYSGFLILIIIRCYCCSSSKTPLPGISVLLPFCNSSFHSEVTKGTFQVTRSSSVRCLHGGSSLSPHQLPKLQSQQNDPADTREAGYPVPPVSDSD